MTSMWGWIIVGLLVPQAIVQLDKAIAIILNTYTYFKRGY